MLTVKKWRWDLARPLVDRIGGGDPCRAAEL